MSFDSAFYWRNIVVYFKIYKEYGSFGKMMKLPIAELVFRPRYPDDDLAVTNRVEFSFSERGFKCNKY